MPYQICIFCNYIFNYFFVLQSFFLFLVSNTRRLLPFDTALQVPKTDFFSNIFPSCKDLRNPIDLPSSLLTHFSDAWYCTMVSIDWLNFCYLFNLYFNCICMGALPSSGLCTTLMQRLQRETRMSHTLELEFQVVMGCQACADNQT